MSSQALSGLEVKVICGTQKPPKQARWFSPAPLAAPHPLQPRPLNPTTQRGAGLIEYVLLVALVALVGVASVRALG